MRNPKRLQPISEAPTVLMIVGWGRSGSTLLSRCLGRIPGAVEVGELREIWTSGVAENRLCACGETFGRCPFWTEVGNLAFGGWDTEQARLGNKLRLSIDRGYMLPALLAGSPGMRARVSMYQKLLVRLYRAVSEVSGADMVIDTSKLASHALLVFGTGMASGFLHLIRDSRGVAYSWRKTYRRRQSEEHAGSPPLLMRKYGAVSASARYLYYNLMGQALSIVSDHYTRLRYEDFVANPVALSNRALDALGLPDGRRLSPTMIREGRVRIFDSHMVDGNPMRFTDEELVIRSDIEWVMGLGRMDFLTTTSITAIMLKAYGYSLSRRSRTGA